MKRAPSIGPRRSQTPAGGGATFAHRLSRAPFLDMARGAKTLSARPPPQAWLANCLDPTARVVTVSAKELGAMIEAREAKTSKSAPSRATAKRGRGEGSRAKYTVTEKEGFVWVKCDECSKRRYAPEAKAKKSAPDAKWKVRRGASNARLIGSQVAGTIECATDQASRLSRLMESPRHRLSENSNTDLPFLPRSVRRLQSRSERPMRIHM